MPKKPYVDRNYGFDTKAIHVGQENPDPATGARAVPIYQTSAFVFNDADHAAARFALKDAGNIYARLTNPTEDVFEQRVAALEGGVAALGVASGAAAVTYAFKAVAHAGDHIVSAKNIYGGTYNYLAHTFTDYGVTTTFVDPYNYEEVEAAIQRNTKALYAETLGNPNGEVLDLDKWVEIAHKHDLPLIIDNTFATPVQIRPIEHGADIVVHSATKFIGGHGTTIGGVIVDAGKFNWNQPEKWPWLATKNESYHGVTFATDCAPATIATYLRAIILRDEGATLAPLNAWLLLQGIETLSLRVERHTENALKVVDYLSKNPHVAYVSHPAASKDPVQQALYQKYYPNGAGSIFTFDIDGDEQKAKDFIDHLELFSLLANVADVKSLVVHPATTTHAECNDAELADQGIKRNTIRLSIGIENVEDIIADLDRAFKAVFGD